MASESIICGIDASERDPDVLRVAVPLSGRLSARLILVHVAHVPQVPGASAIPGAYQELCEAAVVEGYDLLEGVANECEVPPGTELAVELGDPGERIAAVARDVGAELIVVASRGLRGPKSALLGSVSASLAATAPCPVIVVPPGGAREGRFESSPREPVRER